MTRGLLLILTLFGFISGLRSQDLAGDSIHWSVELTDVVVTAQYAPTDVREAVHPVRLLDRRDIANRFSATLDEVLAYDAGIRVRQDLILGSALSLLGQDGQGIKILVDGIPVVGRMNGNIDLGQLPLHQIERIEIVEGPLSVQYGTDALGGVINLITRSSQVGRVEPQLRASYESLGESRLDGSLGVWVRDDLLVRMHGGGLRFDGVAFSEGRDILWNPKEQWYAGGQARWNLKDGMSLRYRGQIMEEEIVNLGEIRRPQFKPYAFDDTYLTNRQDHTLQFNSSWSQGRLYTEIITSLNHWDRIKRRERTDLEAQTGELILGEQDTNDITGYHIRATTGTQFAGKWNGLLGTEMRWDVATGDRIIDPREREPGYSRIADYAVFGSLRYQPWKWLEAEAGARWAYNERYPSPVVPSIHLRIPFDPAWTLRASYARGFRAPNARELYFQFVDANHFILGNPDLKPEESDNVQVSLDWRKAQGDWQWEARAMGFVNQVRDRIDIYEYYEVDGERIPTRGDTTTLQFAYFNFADFRTHGGQVRAEASWRNWSLQGTWQVTGFRQNEANNDASVPTWTYANEASGEVRWSWPKVGLGINFLGRYYDRLLSFYPEPGDDGQAVVRRREQAGYTLLDANVRKSFWEDRIRLNVGIRNLLGVRQTGVLDTGASLQHNSGTGMVPVSAGRTWIVGVELVGI